MESKYVKIDKNLKISPPFGIYLFLTVALCPVSPGFAVTPHILHTIYKLSQIDW